MRIWKYPLEVTDRQVISVPVGEKFLTAQMQNSALQLWALVDEQEPIYRDHTIAVYGTGNVLPDDPGTYIATFQMAGGALVFHVFEVTA